ncbi:5-formyltetrahydrofolate cyclo-ligase [Poritiphilus flavus]|uniref:5-formyltetrahydrofolate cyclo-ligase n=1 Tax=Poritiphilus flavus TaxID=2697053 RepID=A0A6L9ED63_9FLAO|nr:5-formyltetrahydrofolate cyclo-ligase [Poritiphilus flavus]NAS12563.1 5-formyltetrahydrofolate cyclo-ligase [Poritiphilus flavus]
MLKKDLRSQYAKLREKLSLQALNSASLVLTNKLLDLPIWDLHFYHIFLQIEEKKEVNTSFLLSVLQGKDKNIVIPKIEGRSELRHFLLTDNTVLKKNSWNVPEPVAGLEVPVEKIDVVFMPLLAFDKSGNRLGYGKGFYDNFLRQCRPDVIKIGLSLFEAEEAIPELQESDIPMNYCVTPKETYIF